MTKTLTEQWRDKELKDGDYYIINKSGNIVCDYYIEILGHFDSVLTENVKEVLAPVPSYDEYLYLKTNNDHWNKEAIRISKQAIGIVLESDELVQKIHILNEQNTKQYNELCEEIKKNNILEKKLEIATKALNGIRDVWANNPSQFSFIARIANRKAKTALEEMEGVK